MGIDQQQAEEIGLSIYKVALIWPLEPEGIREFVKGLDEVIVIEESRPFLEPQVKEALFNLSEQDRPPVIGKYNSAGQRIFPSHGELTPALIAEAQDHLILELSEFNHKVIRRYSSLPMMVLEVERGASAYLLDSPLVKSVQPDTLSHTMQ